MLVIALVWEGEPGCKIKTCSSAMEDLCCERPASDKEGTQHHIIMDGRFSPSAW